jgi:peptidoglycan hydrolase-like protein with peptidoglycan-binding domain
MHARLLQAIAAACLLLAPTSALAASGGVGVPDPTLPQAASFGDRVLRVGMTGADVRVLNVLVRSKPYAPAVRLSTTFEAPTRDGVRLFQERRGLRPTGVVGQTTADELVRTMGRARATWYGPGLYGNTTACGQVLRAGTVGLAHKTLPCGTVVAIAYRGRFLVAKVIDRGPYNPGYTWDLTNGARRLLGFDGVGEVRHAIVRR